MKYYTDGYTIYTNPSMYGGGFVISDEKKIVLHLKVFKNHFTNNEAELLGVYTACSIAKNKSTISTDSQNTLAWIRSCNPKARQDLKPYTIEISNLIREKKLNLIYEPRELNKAGIYIEKNKFENFK